MKKIIRLTESDLTRIVRRVIKEQTNTDQQKYEQILNSIQGVGTDEKLFFSALMSIKDKNEYERINTIAKSKGEDIPTLFSGDFDDITSIKQFCGYLNKIGVSLPDNPCRANILGMKSNQYNLPNNKNQVGTTTR